MLPGGKAILLTVASSDILSFDDARLAVLSLETGKVTELIRGGSYGRFVAPDHLLYCRSGAVLAAPFDPKRLAVTGPSATVLDGVVTYPASGAAQFAMSEAGSLAFIPGGSRETKRTLTWFDRQGRATPVGLAPAAFQNLHISPDGRSVALNIDGANASIWIHEFGSGGIHGRCRFVKNCAEDPGFCSANTRRPPRAESKRIRAPSGVQTDPLLLHSSVSRVMPVVCHAIGQASSAHKNAHEEATSCGPSRL